MQVAAFAQTKSRFGSLDIVCNNAGIGEDSDWEKVLHINLVLLSVQQPVAAKGEKGIDPISLPSSSSSFFSLLLFFFTQHAVILGTMTAMEHMSISSGGRGGVVINVASMAGESTAVNMWYHLPVSGPAMVVLSQ